MRRATVVLALLWRRRPAAAAETAAAEAAAGAAPGAGGAGGAGGACAEDTCGAPWLPEAEAAEPLAQGWAAGPAQEAGEDGPCRDLFEVVPAAAAQRWHQRAEPAVVEGVAAAGAWEPGLFGRGRLREQFGDVRVGVFSPAQAALLGGQTARVHPLLQVLRSLRNSPQLLYVFDKAFFPAHASARRAFRVPRALAMAGMEQILTLGGAGAGTQFHTHGAAFLTLLAGRKRWYFHRPGLFPNASARALHMDMLTWAFEVLPALPEDSKPLICVQYPGDTLFVPDSWAHATANLDETVGVAWQRVNTSLATCDLGQDYMCLLQQFAHAVMLDPPQQHVRLSELFDIADQVTGGWPAGCLRFLRQYREVPTHGRAIMKRERARLFKFVKAAKPHSDEAILAAALSKTLADAFAMGAHKQRFEEAAAVMLPAVRKAPESGLGVPLAQLYGQQGKWLEAREQLERHSAYFPDDAIAATMLSQAQSFVGR